MGLKLPAGLGKAAGLGLDFLAPSSCLLCGDFLWGGGQGRLPLCPSCLAGLAPLEGRLCPRCGRPLFSEEGLCMKCRRHRPSFDEAAALFAYRGPAAALIGAYKFGARASLAPLFAELLEAKIRRRWPERVIVPVPPRRGARRERGWDQVELLLRKLEARGFAAARVLERLPSAQQKRLDFQARQENARKAYVLREGALPPRLVLLLDDVLTTGATAEACAEALKAGGSESVAFLALAAEL